MIRKALASFRRQMYYTFGILLIAWLCTPFAEHLLGFGVGLMVSVYCAWLLGRRIERMGESIMLNKRMPSLGTVNRFAAAILGCLVLYEIEHHMAMWAFATGILGGYTLLVVNLGYYSAYHQEQKSAQGESI
ncbi:ATP synthase subunit I [Ectobacillus ponti]|uniref:ATP synthase subunit I n=1 Tax=Ectobacillus ponti TaxID=2961894 RepID=A0AA41X958_9BACI|nr:ATP synthase subunit I [Ectobacillus ponti]MCP8968588.1 ATP synthase subunit I [Ectobacillus ponti]